MIEKKVAVVTGGGTGIGAACVREMAAKGFRVGIHYRSSAKAAAVLLNEIGDGFLLQADLADIADVEVAPKMEGYQMFTIFVPKKAKVAEKKSKEAPKAETDGE